MSCMASTPYLCSKHKAIFSAVSKLRCITWPPYFTLLSCRVFGAVQAETEGSVVLHEAAILPSWHCILVPSRKWSRSSRYNRRVAPISVSSMLDSVLTALLSAVGARELLLLLPSCFNGDSQFIFPGHPRSKLWTLMVMTSS